MALLFVHGDFFLPTWAITVLLIQGRGAFSKATVAFALIIGICVAQGVATIINKQISTNSRKVHMRLSMVGILIILYVSFSSIIENRNLLSPLSVQERQAMVWVSTNTASTARFLVISPDWWGADRVSEWFPVLSHRNSILTVQGYEFAPNNAFSERIKSSKLINSCVLANDLSCIEDWSKTQPVSYTYLYIPKRAPITQSLNILRSGDCCIVLRKAVQESSHYQKVFENSDAAIFQIISPKFKAQLH
jgi:hypothetical protein